jgi:hypothetical protein
MRNVMLAALLLLLAACKQGGAITCPTLRGYSPAFMAAAARELEGLDRSAPHLVQMFNDYGVERDAIRECLRRQKVAK